MRDPVRAFANQSGGLERVKSTHASHRGSVVVLASPRVVRRSAGALAVLLVLATVGVGAISLEAAERLTHPPRERVSWTPAARGLDYEAVAFQTVDGVRLSGWFLPADDPRGTIVFLHGYGASKSQAQSVAPFLVRAHFQVLAFDFRAHGDSEGVLTTVGIDEAEDVRAAVAYLLTRSDVDPERIALFGWSMGAAAALNAAVSLPQLRAIVADSSFASLSNLFGANLDSLTGLPQYPFAPLIVLFASAISGHAPGDNEPARSASLIHRPLFVIQGEEDGIADPERDGKRLALAAGGWAQLWLVPGAGHVDARRAEPREYETRVVAFLQEALA